MKFLRIAGGAILIVFGVVGSVVPVIPGLVFIISGLALLAPDVPLARRIFDRLPVPEKIKKKVRGYFGPQ